MLYNSYRGEIVSGYLSLSKKAWVDILDEGDNVDLEEELKFDVYLKKKIAKEILVHHGNIRRFTVV